MSYFQETLETLVKAKAIIDTPEKWTQGCFARDAEAGHVDRKSPYATCFCTIGAVMNAATTNGGVDGACEILGEIIAGPSNSGSMNAVDYNDTEGRTHAEIMELFDKAIALTLLKTAKPVA